MWLDQGAEKTGGTGGRGATLPQVKGRGSFREPSTKSKTAWSGAREGSNRREFDGLKPHP